MSSYSTVLLDGIVKHEEPSDGVFQVTRFRMDGEPQANAIVAAVASRFEPMTDEQLLALDGKKVTLLASTQGMFGAGAIQALEGKIFAGRQGPALLPKGRTKNGISLVNMDVLGYRDGYGQTEWFQGIVDQVRGQFPKVAELTQEVLDRLPEPDGSPEAPDCTVALFGTLRFVDGPIPGCIWLLSDYDRENDIVNGVLFVPPSIAESEHGSAYGADLMRAYGVVEDFRPISFSDALSLVFSSYDDVLARVLGRDGELVPA